MEPTLIIGLLFGIIIGIVIGYNIPSGKPVEEEESDCAHTFIWKDYGLDYQDKVCTKCNYTKKRITK